MWIQVSPKASFCSFRASSAYELSRIFLLRGQVHLLYPDLEVRFPLPHSTFPFQSYLIGISVSNAVSHATVIWRVRRATLEAYVLARHSRASRSVQIDYYDDLGQPKSFISSLLCIPSPPISNIRCSMRLRRGFSWSLFSTEELAGFSIRTCND